MLLSFWREGEKAQKIEAWAPGDGRNQKIQKLQKSQRIVKIERVERSWEGGLIRKTHQI